MTNSQLEGLHSLWRTYTVILSPNLETMCGHNAFRSWHFEFLFPRKIESSEWNKNENRDMIALVSFIPIWQTLFLSFYTKHYYNAVWQSRHRTKQGYDWWDGRWRIQCFEYQINDQNRRSNTRKLAKCQFITEQEVLMMKHQSWCVHIMKCKSLWTSYGRLNSLLMTQRKSTKIINNGDYLV